MGKERSEPVEGRLRGISHAAVRAVSCSSSPSSPSSGWTCCCAFCCCSSASEELPASGTFASAPLSASPSAPPHVAADSPVVAAPLGRAIGAYVPQQRLCLDLGLGVVVRRVGGRRHLEDVDRAVGRGEGAACGVQVYRLQHARRQPVPRAGAGVGMMFYTDHNIRGEATRRVCPVTPSRRFPVTTATPGTAAMGGAGALTLPRTVRLVRSQTRPQNLAVPEGATLAARLDTSIVKVRAAAVCCS